MRKKPQKQARTSELKSPLPRTRTRSRPAAAADPAIRRAVRAALRRERQLREAQDRYRRRHRDQLRRKARDRRGGGQEWTLPPSPPPYHDERFCTPAAGHHPGCPHYVAEPYDGQLADDVDPDDLKVPFPRRSPRRPAPPPLPKPRDTRLDGLSALGRSKVRPHLDHLDEVAGCECLRCFERGGTVRVRSRRVYGPNRGGESARSWGEGRRRDDISNDEWWKF